MKFTSLALFVITVFLFGCTENVEHSFKDYEAFSNSSNNLKSWVPELISEDCYNIKEVHNIDINQGFGTFNYVNEIKIDTLISDLRIREVSESDFFAFINTMKAPKRPEWFLNLGDMTTLKLFKKEHLVIAKDPKTKKIYFAYKEGYSATPD